jgi:hypothetical protein
MPKTLFYAATVPAMSPTATRNLLQFDDGAQLGPFVNLPSGYQLG